MIPAPGGRSLLGRRGLSACAAALLGLAACSSSGPSRPAPGPSTQAAATDLKAGLLALTDLPGTGWKVDTTTTSLIALTAKDNATCKQEMAQLDTVATAPVHAEARFTTDQTALVQLWGSYSTVAAAQAVLDGVGAAIHDCHDFGVPGQSGLDSASFALTVLPDPVVGEKSLAFKGNNKDIGYSITVTAVLARYGTSVELLVEGGLSTDDSLVARLARLGVQRLA